MANSGEVGVPEFVKLMRDYLEQRVDASQYRSRLFSLFKQRMIVQNEVVSQVLQEAYGDADDYDPVVRLPYTIQEPELKARVQRSLERLGSLGCDVTSRDLK